MRSATSCASTPSGTARSSAAGPSARAGPYGSAATRKCAGSMRGPRRPAPIPGCTSRPKAGSCVPRAVICSNRLLRCSHHAGGGATWPAGRRAADMVGTPTTVRTGGRIPPGRHDHRRPRGSLTTARARALRDPARRSLSWGLSLGYALLNGMQHHAMLDASELDFELEGPWHTDHMGTPGATMSLAFIDPSLGGSGYLDGWPTSSTSSLSAPSSISTTRPAKPPATAA